MEKIQTRPSIILSGGLVFGFYLLVAGLKGLGGPMSAALSTDALVLKVVSGAVMFGILFLAGHMLLQKLNLTQYAAYIGMGAVCAVTLHLLHISHDVWEQVVASGNLSTHLLLPAFIGAVLGSGYRRMSVFTDFDEDVDGLAKRYQDQLADQGETGDSDAGLIVHGDMAYYDGPLQVRTSVPALLFATIVGCIADIGVTMVFRISLVSDVAGAARQAFSSAELLIAAFGGFLSGLAFSLLTFLPVMFLVILAHMALRGLGRTSYAAYGVGGLLSSPVAIILTGGMAASIGFLAVVPAMVAALAYRQFAGLEPVPVAEDVIARRTRDLVGKDHVRRKAGRVVLKANGSGNPILSRKKAS